MRAKSVLLTLLFLAVLIASCFEDERPGGILQHAWQSADDRALIKAKDGSVDSIAYDMVDLGGRYSVLYRYGEPDGSRGGMAVVHISPSMHVLQAPRSIARTEASLHPVSIVRTGGQECVAIGWTTRGNVGRYGGIVAYSTGARGSLPSGLVFDTDSPDIVMDAVADEEGSMYLVGHTAGKRGERQSEGGTDCMVLKLSSNGDCLWESWLATGSNDSGMGIVIGADGDIYVSGSTEGRMDAMGREPQGAERDIFLAKLSADSGRKVWCRQIGSDDSECATCLSRHKQRLIIGGCVKQVPEGGEVPALFGRPVVFACNAADGVVLWRQWLTEQDEQGFVADVAVDSIGQVGAVGYTCTAAGAERKYEGSLWLVGGEGRGKRVWSRPQSLGNCLIWHEEVRAWYFGGCLIDDNGGSQRAFVERLSLGSPADW